MLLENKVAVITGIGPGLGREIAVQFAREGAAVAIGARTESVPRGGARRDRSGGRARRCRAHRHRRPRALRAHRRRPRSTRSAASTSWCRTGSRPRRSRSSRTPTSTSGGTRWTSTCGGASSSRKPSIPSLKERGGGSIVVRELDDHAQGAPVPGRLRDRRRARSMTAAQVLARELGQYKIRVNSIVPGWMWGPSVDVYFEIMETQGKPTRRARTPRSRRTSRSVSSRPTRSARGPRCSSRPTCRR